ncbi:hypothetical protein Tco_0765040 [Tanacetum coccineum]
MSISNHQTLAKSGATDRPPILEKGNYIPWESRFRRFLENKQEDGERIWRSITKGPYKRPMITDPDDPDNKITKPMSKMTEANKKQYVADVKSSQSHASPSYSHSPQQYYVTYPSSLVDYEEDYQGELQGDAHEDKLITTMMLLERAITQKFSTPTNNRLCISSNTRNQAVIHDGRVDIQTKNVVYGRNGNRNTWRQNKNQATNAGNGQIQQIDESHCARDCLKPKVRDAKYFREQMLLAMKDEAGGTLNDEENDFMLDNAYGDETLEELTEAISELKTVINTSDDDQIDYNIIFDYPYVANNGGTDEHDSNAHDQSFDIESLVYNVLIPMNRSLTP